MPKTAKKLSKHTKCIPIKELEVFVSILVKCSRNQYGDCTADVAKPVWWPRDVKFAYPIKKPRSQSRAMWRQDLVNVLTKYYHISVSRTQSPATTNALSRATHIQEAFRQIEETLVRNNNKCTNSCVPMGKEAPQRGDSRFVKLGESTLQMLLPRLEVRLHDILDSDEYRHLAEKHQLKRKDDFLRHFDLIATVKYDYLNLNPKYKFRASTKLQSNNKPSLPVTPLATEQIVLDKRPSTLGNKATSPVTTNALGCESNVLETGVDPLEYHSGSVGKARTVSKKRITTKDPKSQDGTVHDSGEENCRMYSTSDLEKAPLDLPLTAEERTENSLKIVKDNAGIRSSSKREDLDKLSLKSRLLLQQCSPSFVKVRKMTAKKCKRLLVGPETLSERRYLRSNAEIRNAVLRTGVPTKRTHSNLAV